MRNVLREISAILANTYPRFTDLFRSVLTPYTGALVDLIRADMAAGEYAKIWTRHGREPVDRRLPRRTGSSWPDRQGFTRRCVDIMWMAMNGGAVSDR